MEEDEVTPSSGNLVDQDQDALEAVLPRKDSLQPAKTRSPAVLALPPLKWQDLTDRPRATTLPCLPFSPRGGFTPKEPSPHHLPRSLASANRTLRAPNPATHERTPRSRLQKQPSSNTFSYSPKSSKYSVNISPDFRADTPTSLTMSDAIQRFLEKQMPRLITVVLMIVILLSDTWIAALMLFIPYALFNLTLNKIVLINPQVYRRKTLAPNHCIIHSPYHTSISDLVAIFALLATL